MLYSNGVNDFICRTTCLFVEPKNYREAINKAITVMTFGRPLTDNDNNPGHHSNMHRTILSPRRYWGLEILLPCSINCFISRNPQIKQL